MIEKQYHLLIKMSQLFGPAIVKYFEIETLKLRIDHERPLDRVRQDRRVLRRHVVRRQPLVVPLGDQGIIGLESYTHCR